MDLVWTSGTTMLVTSSPGCSTVLMEYIMSGGFFPHLTTASVITLVVVVELQVTM